MATSKETVKRAIHFENPDYIPLMYYDHNLIEKSDVVSFFVTEQAGGPKGDTSEWGFKWLLEERAEQFYNPGSPRYPAIEEWDQLADYKPLDAWRPGRFDKFKAVMEKYPDKYYVANTECANFTLCAFIRGFENFMCDLYEEPEYVQQLVDIVFDAEEQLIRACAEAGFDAVWWEDDWGTQRGLFISPQIIQKYFLPRMKQAIDLAHSLGMDMWMHTCGYVYELIPDIIATGMDGLNLGQTSLHGVERLAQDFGGKICFLTPGNYQSTGITGTVEEIFDEIKSFTEHLNTPAGGMVGLVSAVSTRLGYGAPEENALALPAAFEAYCGKNHPIQR